MHKLSISIISLLLHLSLAQGSQVTPRLTERSPPSPTGSMTQQPDLEMPEPTPAVDPRDITISAGWGPPYITGCSYCSQDSPWGASCTFTSLPGCTSETARVTLEAGSSYVHVGTLTSDALYTSVSNALESICPTPAGGTNITNCSTAKATIGSISFIDSSEILETYGELIVSVESSSYELAQIREAMIQTIATAAAMSATGNNCYTADYNVLSFRKRDDGFWWLPSFLRREAPHETREQITLCNTIDFAGPQYVPPFPKGVSYIDTRFAFHEPPGGDFLCDLLEGPADALAFLLPEFTVEEIEVGEALTVICQQEEDE
ncbi:hypothetical protein F5Y19DRAFT_49580 [Xylariaceae sp. FL1651]|nr:hypothetical protein F5Y19DRAFT_49580 [Xylariaceae sp. FL1651]